MEPEGSVAPLPTTEIQPEEPSPRPPPAVNNKAKQPEFLELLNEADRREFEHIRAALASPACKHRRHHSKEINSEILNRIRQFVVRNDGDDWKRALVCGICWMPDGIVVNTWQLRLLLSKCKSSINALFQNLGYVTVPTSNEFASQLVHIFPIIKDNFAELRKWTPRMLRGPTPQVVAVPAEDVDTLETVPVDEPLPPIEVKKEGE